MKSDGALIYKSIYDAARNLPDEQRLEFYDTIMANRFEDDALESADPYVNALLALLAPVFRKSDKRTEAGRRGGEAKAANREAKEHQNDTKDAPNVYQSSTKSLPNDYQTDTNALPIKDKGYKDKRIKDKGEEEKNARTRADAPQEQTTVKRTVFRPPTAPDVWAYAEENGLDIDAEAFCDFYASKNWMVGRTKMTDWKAAARNWSRRDRERSAPQEAKKPASGTFGAFDQRKTPYETLFPSKYA